MSLYKVTGPRAYRGHEPGATFEATLNEAAEQRALSRQAIRKVVDGVPTLQPGSWLLPGGWPTTIPPTTGGQER